MNSKWNIPGDVSFSQVFIFSVDMRIYRGTYYRWTWLIQQLPRGLGINFVSTPSDEIFEELMENINEH
jgi:hypothetical protein